MKKLIIFSIAMMFVLALTFSGCVEQTNEVETQTAEGTLQLKITDKPGELDIISANVTISSILVHKVETDEETDDDTTEEESDDEETSDGFSVDANGEYQGTAGVDIQFLGTASGGEEPYNWSWDFGDGNTSDLQNPLYNYSTDGTYTVNLSVTDNASNVTWDVTMATIGETEEEDTSEDGWFTFIEEEQTFDLIKLQDVSDILGEKNLTAGKYTQIRLTVESATIIINNSGNRETHELQIPSGKVKLVKAFWINENETTTLTLDFDIYKSVHQTGSNKFIMKPTIKIIEG